MFGENKVVQTLALANDLRQGLFIGAEVASKDAVEDRLLAPTLMAHQLPATLAIRITLMPAISSCAVRLIQSAGHTLG